MTLTHLERHSIEEQSSLTIEAGNSDSPRQRLSSGKKRTKKRTKKRKTNRKCLFRNSASQIPANLANPANPAKCHFLDLVVFVVVFSTPTTKTMTLLKSRRLHFLDVLLSLVMMSFVLDSADFYDRTKATSRIFLRNREISETTNKRAG